MIKNKHYLEFLNLLISCINNGDYYSVKELAILELEKMKKIKKENEIEIKIVKRLNKRNRMKDRNNKKINSISQEELNEKVNLYAIYLTEKIKKAKNIKTEIISFEEFIEIFK